MNKIGLYLHYPFCKAKCAYCDFYSLGNSSRSRQYEAKLASCFAQLEQTLSNHVADTVYFGGGTPGLCSPEGLKAIFSSLNRHLSVAKNAEITMEMNPESVGEPLLFCAKEAGVNRLSMGMQSAHDGELQTLGRIHSFRDVKNAVCLARKAGFENLSLDLMYGLPNQTVSSFLESVDRALDLGVLHLSFYCLTLSPQVPLYARAHLLPQDEVVREMYLSAVSRLKEKGLNLYEISNAAVPGFESRHNLKYWSGEAYLGIGPGAHSLFENQRFFMKEDLCAFLDAASFWDCVEGREARSEEDLRTEYVMLSLRTAKGMDLDKLLRLSDETFVNKTKEKMTLWSKHGLAKVTEKGFALTPEGFFVSNEIISELI